MFTSRMFISRVFITEPDRLSFSHVHVILIIPVEVLPLYPFQVCYNEAPFPSPMHFPWCAGGELDSPASGAVGPWPGRPSLTLSTLQQEPYKKARRRKVSSLPSATLPETKPRCLRIRSVPKIPDHSRRSNRAKETISSGPAVNDLRQSWVWSSVGSGVFESDTSRQSVLGFCFFI